MITQYFLLSGKETIGPYTEKEILRGLAVGTLTMFDHILNQQTGEWVMLMQHPDFVDAHPIEFDNTSPGTLGIVSAELKPIGLVNSSSDDSEQIPEIEPVFWYVKNEPGMNFNFLKIVSLLKSNRVSEHSLISKNPQGPWKKLIEWEEFSPESRRSYQKEAKLAGLDLKLRRADERFLCGKHYIVTKNENAYKIFCSDISLAGMGLITRGDLFALHDNTYIKFKDVFNSNRFDAKGEIVSRGQTTLPGFTEMFYRYGLRFTKITASACQMIKAMGESRAD